MLKNLCVLVLCFACIGCVQDRREQELVQLSEKTLIDNKQDKIAKRIATLNMTAIAASAGVQAKYLRTLQLLKTEYGANIPPQALMNKAVLYCADSTQNRLKFMRQAVNSNHSIIWAVQGGFGANMLIAEMNKWPTPKHKKTLIGFSDTTSLLLFVSQKWGWRAIHAPVLAHLSKPAFAENKFTTLLDILEGRIQKYDISAVYPLNAIARKQKSVSGKLIGGNLTLVETSIGTCWEIQPKEKILFLEDVNLNPWRIYRSLYHLKESGRLNGVKAIVFGSFTKAWAPQKEVVDTLRTFANSVGIPVYVTDQFGHGRNNMPLVYNAKAILQDNKMTINIGD